MVNNKINLTKRIDKVGVSTKLLHSSTHGGQVYNSGYTRKILEKNTSGLKWNFNIILGSLLPVKDCFYVGS
jgi:hypothetical protein